MDPIEENAPSVFSSPKKGSRQMWDITEINASDESHGEDSPLLEQGRDDAPHDRFNLVYIAMFLEGVGLLFPWNAFITVTNYFHYRLEGSTFQNNFDNYYSFTFQACNIVVLMVVMRYQHRMSLSHRILWPLVLQLIVFGLMTAIVKIDMDADTFFAVTLVQVILAGGATAFLQSGLFGMAGCLPQRYMQSLMGGQGLGGVIVACLNLITLAATSGKPSLAALMFFIISDVLLIVCIGGFFFLRQQPLVKHYMGVAERHARETRLRRESNPSLLHSLRLSKKRRRLSGILGSDDRADTLMKVLRLSISVFLVFACTLSIFPGVSDRIQSLNGKGEYKDTLFVPIACFLMFNVADLIGRMMAGWVKFPSLRNSKWLLWISVARFALVPLFLLCNVQLGTKNHFPVVFDHDAYPYVFMFILGTTNGYFGSLCMMFGPTKTEPREMELAGSVMVWFLTVGLLVGTLISFAYKGIMCECNPFA